MAANNTGSGVATPIEVLSNKSTAPTPESIEVDNASCSAGLPIVVPSDKSTCSPESMDAENTAGGAVALIDTPSKLVGAVINLLSLYNRFGGLNEPAVLRDLCFSLARGIDHAIANNEVPIRSRELPQLLPQVTRWKHDFSILASFMTLMMSVKSACKIGWFQNKETDDLLSLANEVKRLYWTEERIHEPCDAFPCISKILSRFYPKIKMKNILTSVEVKPGYRIFAVDFHILRDMVAPDREKIGLVVAQTDNMDTSCCIITPQKVNFLLNGKGVPGRINTAMESKPQLPTNLTAIAKYGVNLLQAVGNFDGHYIIIIAIVSAILSSDTPKLQDYVQPNVASGCSDLDIIEMPSRISLNCPISRNRIRTPVKGHRCKHSQCFDYENFLEINSRIPFWRCPLCKNPVCCPDIRIDQNVVKVLRDAEESIVDVIISMDGSWKAVSDNKDDSSKKWNSLQDDTKRFSAAEKLVLPEVNNWRRSAAFALSGLAANFTSLSAQGNNVSVAPPLTSMQSPVLPETASLTGQKGHMDDHRSAQATPYMQNHLHRPNCLNTQQSSYGRSINEFKKFTSINRQADRNSRQPWLYQNAFNPIGASAPTSQITHSMAANIGGHDLFQEGTERMNQASWSNINASISTTISSPAMQNHSVRQGIGLPTQNLPAYYSSLPRSPSAYPNGLQSLCHSPQNLNTAPPFNNSSVNANRSIRVQPVQFQRDGGAQAPITAQQVPKTSNTDSSVFVQHPASKTNSAYSPAMVNDKLRTAGVQRQNMHGEMPHQISHEGRLVEQASEGWRPSGRMRGSLQGQAYSEALNQFIFQPTQPSRASEQPHRFMPTPPGPPQMPGSINSTNTQNLRQMQAQPSQGDAANLPGSSYTYPNNFRG